MTPEELRADVPALADGIYVNYGASGPSPRRVVEAAEAFIERHEYDSPCAEGMYDVGYGAKEEAREVVADFVGAAPEEVALTESTTDGINRIAGALEWAPDDVVVRTDMEHPGGILPWDRLARHHDVEVRVVGSDRGRLDLDAYRGAVDGAKLVCLSALTWNYGTRLPVADLVDVAHDAGALVLVDAVQVPGQVPMDVAEWGADAVAAGGHKWLLGLWGGGFLYVESSVADALVPGAIGHRGVVDSTADEYELAAGARRFELSTTGPAPHVALAAAIETVEAVGIGAVGARIDRLARRLVEGVPDGRLLSPSSPESGIVTVDVDDPEATVERLKEDGIATRELPYPDAVRACVHAVNTAEEVDGLLAVLAPEW